MKPVLPTREEIARKEIGHTVVGAGPKYLLLFTFLALIGLYPPAQLIWEVRTGSVNLSGWRRVADASGLGERNRELRGVLKTFESEREEASWLQRKLLPPVQGILLEYLGFGNEKVIVGAEGWLFYAADFTHLVHPGFLRAQVLAQRALTGVQPDPVVGIVDFARQLQARGIELIVVPVPAKSALYGEKLGGRVGVAVNPDWAQLVTRLAAARVGVVELAPDLAALRASGVEAFLKSDTHWTPEGMAVAARKIAATLGRGNSGVRGEPRRVTASGDLAGMLKRADPAAFFPAEMVTVEAFDWQPRRNAEVLLLGDSFTQMYSLPALNWGVESGLAERLMAELKAPVDVIARNDDGAYATRQLLADELRRGRDRLAGKRVVVWEFACRELTDGDWRLIDLQVGAPPPERFLNPNAPVLVTATVLAVSALPQPGRALYKDQVVSVHLGDIDAGDAQALVYLSAMCDRRLTPAARLRPGERVRIRLSPWRSCEAQYGGWYRSELPDPALLMQEPCWGELVGEESRRP